MIIKMKDSSVLTTDYIEHKMIEKGIYLFTKPTGEQIVITNVKEVIKL